MPNFKAASDALQTAGDALLAFATELEKNKTNPRLSGIDDTLKAQAPAMANVANAEDNSFKKASDDLNTANLTQFSNVGGLFGNATFTAGGSGLSDSAPAFKTFAESFQGAASEFNTAATGVTEKNFADAKSNTNKANFDNAKSAFETASEKFGKINPADQAQNGAVIKLYDSIKGKL